MRLEEETSETKSRRSLMKKAVVLHVTEFSVMTEVRERTGLFNVEIQRQERCTDLYLFSEY